MSSEQGRHCESFLGSEVIRESELFHEQLQLRHIHEQVRSLVALSRSRRIGASSSSRPGGVTAVETRGNVSQLCQCSGSDAARDRKRRTSRASAQMDATHRTRDTAGCRAGDPAPLAPRCRCEGGEHGNHPRVSAKRESCARRYPQHAAEKRDGECRAVHRRYASGIMIRHSLRSSARIAEMTPENPPSKWWRRRRRARTGD